MLFSARRFCILLLLISSVLLSCGPRKLCSGLNPEIGKYNTSKRLNKGGRTLKSKPERDSLRRRKKSMKSKGGFSAKGRYGGSGGIHIFGGGSIGGRGSVSGSANAQKKS